VYILIPILLIPQLLLSGVIVHFDKLNPILTTQKNVPMSGEVMTSRWAFEALAVNQYKSNEFEKNFYAFDKKKSVSSFKKDYLIPKLKAKIDKSLTNYKDAAFKSEVMSDLALCKAEIKKEMNVTKQIQCPVVDQLNLATFNEDVAAKIQDYLTNVQQYYIKAYNLTGDAEDKLTTQIQKDQGADKFMQMKNEYENESLVDLVTLRNSMEDKILENDGELIQRSDPVYLDPPANKFLRAQFYAPRKAIFGRYFDTFWVNMAVIWSMTILLIVTLYFDALKKLIDGAENLFSRFGGKKQE
jgi:hypothetical protein